MAALFRYGVMVTFGLSEAESRTLTEERKTDLLSHTTGLLIDLLAQRQSIRLEWYIVILILIEIILILCELFFLA